MRKEILTIGLVAVVLTGGALHASSTVHPRPEVQENIRLLRENNGCPGCDLAGAVLHRGKFAGANLEGANLAGAQLNLADLAGANLKNANLQGANFGGADLAGADLTGANMTGAVIDGAYLAGTRMDGQVVVRKPYAEEGGPGVSEKVFEEAEGKSKNLPYTNQPMVKEEEASPPPRTLQPEGKMEQPAVAEQIPVVSSGEDQARSMPADPLPDKSKQLDVMEDAVIPEQTLRDASKPAAEEQSVESVRQQQLEKSAEAVVASVVETGQDIIEAPETEEPLPTVQPVVPRREDVAEAEVSPPRIEEEVAIEQVPEAAVSPSSPLPAEKVAEKKPETRKTAMAAEEPVDVKKEEIAVEPLADPEAEKKRLLVKQLLDDNRCVACDLSGTDLSGRDLEEADLERVNLQGAILNKTDLEGANLKGADLSGADLRNADLRKADLYRGNVSGADLTGAKLKGALIDSLITTGAVGVDFTGAIGGK